jgi:hypothetical protein
MQMMSPGRMEAGANGARCCEDFCEDAVVLKKVSRWCAAQDAGAELV